VEVLAELDGEPVLVRQGRFLVASFHPELTADTRVHQLFLELVQEGRRSRLSAVADQWRGSRGNREVPPALKGGSVVGA
jgi:hypothetical protein